MLHFDISLIDLNLESRSQECEKALTSAPVISHSFQLIWMQVGILLGLVGVMMPIFIFAHPFNFQWREPYSCDFV